MLLYRLFSGKTLMVILLLVVIAVGAVLFLYPNLLQNLTGKQQP